MHSNSTQKKKYTEEKYTWRRQGYADIVEDTYNYF